MVALPKKALRTSQLSKETDGPVVADGSHQTSIVTFTENGVKYKGFLKKIDADKDYPVLLAYMSVAASLFKQLVEGNLSAEERLVFNDKDELVGTLSISVPNFLPFSIRNEEISDPNIKKYVIPSTETLIEHNFMLLLLVRWFLDDDDCHPKNMSLFGDIDFDMFFYWFTIYIKEPRPGVGITKTLFNHTVKEWENFPNVELPFHWPTYQHPGQHTIPNVLPSAVQGEILKRGLPKVYADPEQFEKLAGNAIAQDQKLAAGLKILLTYQPDMVRGRLVELFGELALNYKALSSPKHPTLAETYEQVFKEFCNDETNQNPFVDFIMEIYQAHYDSFYRVVVFYMGCDHNNYGIPLPATREALYRKPSYYQNIKDWVVKENELNTNNKKSDFPFELDELEKRYHQVWRDSSALTLRGLLYDTHRLTDSVMRLITNKDEEIKLEGKLATDESVTKSVDLFADLPILSLNGVTILADKDSKLRDSFYNLIEFTNELNKAATTYYAIPRHDLTVKDNEAFVESITNLLKKFKQSITTNLANTTSPAIEFHRIATSLTNFAMRINFYDHLYTTDKQMESVPTSEIQKVNLSLDHEETIKDFNLGLFRWASSVKPQELEHAILDIVKNHYETSFGTRMRGPAVREYLSKTSYESGDIRLAHILTTGNEETGSLNMALIKHLAPKILTINYLPVIKDTLNNEFITKTNLALYTKACVHYAKTNEKLCPQNRQLVIANADPALFFNTFYDWIGNLSDSEFRKIIQAAIELYKKEKSTINLFSKPRTNEVQDYFKKTNNPTKIVGLIFAAKAAGSFNKILFHCIVEGMQKDFSSHPEKLRDTGNPGPQLIMQYTPPLYDTKYGSLLKKYAEAPSTLPSERNSMLALTN